ncbi:MAG: hypothetical protein J7497_09765, partial [Chitinophagaceae bacterium]|nr:hypothetical protein [Chitinophagaceae bacterium]
MKLIVTLLLSCLCVKAFTQATIYGPTFVEPGEVAQYEAYFSSPINSYTIISWNVSGGTIISMSTNPTIQPVTIMIQWDYAPTVGSIDIYEDIGGQSGGASIQVGAPYVSPFIQYPNFSTTPQYICANLAASVINATFQWEQSADYYNWTAISGATEQCYLPPAPSSPAATFYRCITTINGNQYTSEPATVEMNPLTPGSIALAQQPTYNTNLNITSLNANGGFCLASNYQYAWEISIEGGPWTTIGTSAGYPSGAPPIVGNTLVRRRITCGSQTLYTNTLDIKLAYTSTDYENRNYIRTYTVTTKGIHSWMQADQLDVGKKFQETNYLDGLGRSLQVVSKGISNISTNTWVDQVTFKKYDNLGRATLNYLPYPTASESGKFKTNTNEQVTYYTTSYNETSPWYKNEFESSPLNRLKKSMDVGSHRINNNIGLEFDYSFNNANGVDEKVHIWRIGYAAGSLPATTASTVYQNGTLPKFTYTNNEGKKIIEYKDLLGNIVLKKVQVSETPGVEHQGWLCTYYVYDVFNRLRYTITPKAVAYLDANNWILTQAIADELCFYVEYDSKGRAILEKKPGSAKQEILYDQRSRAVFTQDGNQAAKATKEWLANIYDEQDRTIISGLYKSNKTAAQLQTDINTAGQITSITVVGPGIENLNVSSRPTLNPPSEYIATNSVNLLPGFASNPNDEFTISIGPVAGIAQIVSVTNNAVPEVDINNPAVFTALMYNYYDNYSFPDAKAMNNSYTNTQAYATGQDIEPITKTNRTINCFTGSKVRVLGTNDFLKTTIYYDESGRVLQSLSDNYKNGEDVTTNQYHFDGRIMSVSAKHGNPGNTFDA